VVDRISNMIIEFETVIATEAIGSASRVLQRTG
jgi:hypothetical protein